MKLLRCIHSLNPAIGGPLQSIRQSSAVLQRRGHEVDVLCLDDPASGWLADFPARAVALGPGGDGYRYTPRLTQWLEQHAPGYDAVIVHGLWQYISFGTWRALAGRRPPYFVFPHGMLDPWFNQAYPLKHLKKLLYWPWAEYRVLRDAAAVLFTSEEERRLASTSFWPYRANEIVVQYGTAGPETDAATTEAAFWQNFPAFKGKPFLLFLGRLHEKKGCELLLTAFAECYRDNPEHWLLLAGPSRHPDYVSMLQKRCAELGLSSRIVFGGMLKGDAKWGALSAADAFVLPSHQENFGIAIAEALACGTPVLISDKVNIWREIVGDGAGLAEPDDAAGVARLLRRWRDMSAAENAQMRQRALGSFQQRFEIEAAVDSLLSALRAGGVTAV